MTEAKKLNINAAPVLQRALVLLAHGWNIFCKAIAAAKAAPQRGYPKSVSYTHLDVYKRQAQGVD